MSNLKIRTWNADKGFGFVAMEGGKSAFLHVTQITPRQPRGVDLTGREVSEVSVIEGDKGLKVTYCRLVDVEGTEGSKSLVLEPSPEDLHAPEMLMYWRFDVESGKILVDRRKGMKLVKVRKVKPEFAEMLGCPPIVLKAAEAYAQALKDVWASEYRPYRLEDKNTRGRILVQIPDQALSIEGDNPLLADPELQEFYPDKDYLGPVMDSYPKAYRVQSFYTLCLWINAANYGRFVQIAKARGWHAVAQGFFGAGYGRDIPVSWRPLDHFQVLAILGLDQVPGQHPEISPVVKYELSKDERAMIKARAAKVLERGKEEISKPYFQLMKFITHDDLRKGIPGLEHALYGYVSFSYGADKSRGNDWLRPDLHATYHTGLTRPRMRKYESGHQVMELPLDWGYVVLTYRSLTCEIFAQSEGNIIQTAYNAFMFVGAVGSWIDVKMSWYEKNGRHSRFYDWTGRITITVHGITAEAKPLGNTNVAGI